MKMKLISAALSAIMLVSGSALALDIDPKFYVGAEVQGNKQKGPDQVTKDNVIYKTLDGKSILGKKHTGSGSLFLGTKLNEFFGLEAGATGFSRMKYDQKKTENNAAGVNSNKAMKLNTKSNNLYIDAMGYLPVADSVDLIGSVGVGRLHSKLTGTYSETPVAGGATTTKDLSQKSSKAGVRLGVGAQYKFNENMGARLMVRHQKGNQLVKDVNSVGLGLFYQF